MDIEYLLLLQQFRSYTAAFLAPIMDWVTKLAVSFWPLLFMLMVYWVYDRRSGRRLLGGFSLALLMNGLLKLIVCAYRPWIRDARVEPYGDAKVAATGYSFPSGHSTWATACWGGIGNWFSKRKKPVTVVLYALVLLTMFSRNYLGVHTPQDVLIGFGATALMLLLANLIENWSDKAPDKRDIVILVVSLLVCAGLAVFYYFKPYPMDYKADGSLVVDPRKMLPDSFEGLGLVSGFAVCRYFERRGFAFDTELPRKDRFIVGTFALLPVVWWHSHIVNIFAALGSKVLGKYVWGVGIIVYAMIIVPRIMKTVKEKHIIGD